MKFLEEITRRTPLLLADDVLGELDARRKARFWDTVGETVQVLATGTEVPAIPSRKPLQLFAVSGGDFKRHV